MSILRAILYGIAGGAVTLLPVSGSQLISLLADLFKADTAAIVPLSLSVHTGVLIALCLSMRGTIVRVYKALADVMMDAFSNCGGLIRRLITGREGDRIRLGTTPDRRLALTVAIASVPTAVIGFLLHDAAFRCASSFLAQGAAALAGAILLLTAHLTYKARHGQSTSAAPRALLMGIIQGLSVLPGLSRTGRVDAMGILCGLSRKAAAHTSFVLLIPAVFGAVLCEAALPGSGAGAAQQIVSGIFAFISALFTLRFAMRIMRKNAVLLFALVNALAGALSILLYIIR